MFWRKPQNTDLTLSSLKLDQLPILEAMDLIQLLGLQARLDSIKSLAAIGDTHFNALYTPSINQYLESVQLAPASASHHHAGPGGLATHTLDVIETALRKRKAYNLPQHSSSELIAAQEHIWTYGVFAGALLHDIGKMVCNSQIFLDNGLLWTPHGDSILSAGAKTYRVEFKKSPYKMHATLSNGFLHLLAPAGRGWLAQYPNILAQLTAWLSGDIYEYGTIGEIVRQADGESVAANLKIGGDRKRFPNAPTIPMVDRITTALRQLIDESKLKINRPNGSSGWCDERYAYMVCGTVANAVRQQLQSSGATDIPSDNSILFDTWQEHDFIVSTPEGGAIWYLTINGSLHLTVLKFEVSRLFHPSRQPAPFAGELSISDTDQAVTHETKTQPQDVTNQPNDTPDIASIEDKTDKQSTKSHTTNPAEKKDKNLFNLNTDSAETNQETVPESDSHHVSNIYMDDIPVQISAKTPGAASDIDVPNLSKTAPNSFDLNDPDLAHYFLDWLRTGIRDGKIASNRRDALVHVVKEGALIVSPLSFKKFAHEKNLFNADNNENDACKKVQNKLEKMMRKTKLHKKTTSGMNIHTYLVQGPKRETKLKGWLLPVPTVYGDIKPPDVNPALANLSGFLATKKE